MCLVTPFVEWHDFDLKEKTWERTIIRVLFLHVAFVLKNRMQKAT